MVCIIRGEPSPTPKLWVGVIAATGESCLWRLAGRSVVEHVIERARPQISALVICTDGDPSPFRPYGLPVLDQGFPGLLAAVRVGLDWTAAHSRETPWVATFAADAPVFPENLVERLGHAIGEQGADMAWVASGGRSVPAFGLWPVRLRRSLKRALEKERDLGAEEWAARFRLARAEFARESQPFVAVSAPEHLTGAEWILAQGSARATVR